MKRKNKNEKGNLKTLAITGNCHIVQVRKIAIFCKTGGSDSRIWT
jgi:hypothetical protein